MVTMEIPIPLIRDYRRINRELLRALNAGHQSITLSGVEGQRLLVAGLQGNWTATIEILGNPGPELASGLEAPGLTLLVNGSAGDGAGARLREGRLLIGENAGDAVGIDQVGGVIVINKAAGNRAGLGQRGGLLLLLRDAGRLLGDRQRNGLIVAPQHLLESSRGRPRSGGRFVALGAFSDPVTGKGDPDFDLVQAVLAGLPDQFG